MTVISIFRLHDLTVTVMKERERGREREGERGSERQRGRQRERHRETERGRERERYEAQCWGRYMFQTLATNGVRTP